MRARPGCAWCLRVMLPVALFATVLAGQNPSQTSMPDMPGMNHSDTAALNGASKFLIDETSGTAFQPSSWMMPMVMTEIGDWHFMWMAQAFIVDTQQAAPRGGDKLYSTNWGMLSAVHNLGKGSILLRTMMSLEPATITNRRYPLLFQVGETAYGEPIIDGQHPHNLFMEIGVQYARSLAEKTTWNVYYAPVGEPALGPVAYPHRASAMEIPQATIGHHWEDSTHISNNVATTGLTYRKLRVEASGFHGAEPNENRWNLQSGAIDSWASRLSIYPASNWAGQVSAGRLTHPEALEPGNQVRITASAEYIRSRRSGNSWATSLIWGQDYNTLNHRRTNTATAETTLPAGHQNFISGRYEWGQRDELFADDPFLAAQIARVTGSVIFQVNAITAGYTRDFPLFRDVQTGVGANASAYLIAKPLESYYGARPLGVNVFFRIRLNASAK